MCDGCVVEQTEIEFRISVFEKDLNGWEKQVFHLILGGYSYRYVAANVSPMETKYKKIDRKAKYDLIKGGWQHFLKQPM